MALCLFASCTEEEVVSENSALRGAIQATIEANVSQSRMAVNNDNSLSWVEGDAFELFTSEGTSETWTLKSVSDGVGLFEGNVPEGELKYAFYPTSETNKPTLSGSEVTMTIPNELTYSANATIDLPMYASVTSGQSMTFKYLTAMLKINVNEIPEGFHTLKVSASQAIAGQFSMNLSNGNIIALDEAAEQKKEVTVSFDAISGADNDRMFYLPLIPANYGSLKVSISNGSDVIVLKEWTDRTIQGRKVYWASLMVKESDTTQPSGVTTELASLTAENPTVTVTLTEPIVADETPIEVPVVEGASAVATLEFAQTPTTSETTPLKIAEATSSSEPVADVSSAMFLSFPDDETNKVYLELETPQNTVTITSGNFATIVAATAPNTFVVSAGVTIENLIVKAGNVVVQAGGEITGEIKRHEDNTDEVFVIVEEGATLDGVTLGENVTKVGGTLVADETWYDDAATELEIDTPQDLYGFIQLLEGGNTFEGKTVKMVADIDMLGYPLETSGMIKNTERFTLFKGIFDGQGHSIKNLEMTYVPAASNGISTSSNVFVALIPRTEGATIQNVTIEGGKVRVPSVAPDNDYFYLGTLVGYTSKSYFINCHNVGCEVILESNGYAGGIIGSVGDSTQEHNNHVIACTNTGSVKSTVTSGTATACIGGVVGAGWGSSAYVVACYNTGVITGPSIEGYGFNIGGVAGDLGGYNYCYSCFNDAVVAGTNSGDLFGGASYSGFYNYSCYTGDLFAGMDLTSEANRVGSKKVSSYAEAVETLNEGIAVYNALETTTVPCNYRFVAGDKPTLQLQ